MLYSMTGFGKATGAYGSKKISVEVRSLNSKQLDLNLRLPSVFKEKEMEVKSRIASSIERGKVDVSVYYENMGEEKAVSINTALAEAYYHDIQTLCAKLDIPKSEILATLMRMPDVISSEKKELDAEEWKTVETLMEQAIQNFQEFRRAE
jgi:uncharacterized protein (TIGR00255 family)